MRRLNATKSNHFSFWILNNLSMIQVSLLNLQKIICNVPIMKIYWKKIPKYVDVYCYHPCTRWLDRWVHSWWRDQAAIAFLGQRETGLRRSRFSIKIRYSLVTVTRFSMRKRFACVEGRATFQKKKKRKRKRERKHRRNRKNNEETSRPSTSDSCRISVASTSPTALDNSRTTSFVGI